MLGNRVKESVSTTGAGSFTTSGASTGFNTFFAEFGLGREFQYHAINDANGEWERGYGSLSAATTVDRLVITGNHLGTKVAVNFTAAPELTNGVGADSMFPAYKPSIDGRWFGSAHSMFANATMITAIDKLHAFTFLWLGGGTVDNIGVAVKTAAGTKFRLGIYEDIGGYPGSLIIATGDLVPVNSTWVSASIPAIDLPVGWYWLGVLCDGGVTFQSGHVNSSLQGIGGMSANGAFPWNQNNYRVTIASGWSVMNDPFPLSVGIANNLPSPKAALQVVV